MQQRRNRLVLVATELHDQSRHRHQVADIGCRGRLTSLFPVKLGRELKCIIKVLTFFI